MIQFYFYENKLLFSMYLRYTSFLAFSRVHTGSTAWLCLPHLARFVTSSGARPTALMPSMTESIHRFLGLPRGQRPPGSRLFLPRSPRHCAWCGRTISGWASLIFSVIAATRSRRLTSSFIMWSVEGQPKHLHFHCVEGWLMFLGRGPAFSTIEGDWANNGLVDLCLEIFWHFLITQDEPRRVDSCSCIGDDVTVWRD